MKKMVFTWILLLMWASGPALAEAPHQLGGFVLNQKISAYEDRLIMDTALPVRYAENIEEVEIKPTEGFKSGLIAYGSCSKPNHIIRIKLKYADSSRQFYDELLKRFKKRFGEPDEYQGDAFKIVIAWKWSFVDEENHRISLILQHNAMDEEEKLGNAVKMTDTTLMEEDLKCYKLKQLDHREKLRQRKWEAVDTGDTGWERYLPR